MELIDRKAVIRIIHNNMKKHMSFLKHDALIDVEFEVDALPTFDAVPVVRCKNCKHWGTGAPGETEHVKCCEYGRYMVGESGYCVYGELRTSAK